MSEDYLLVQGKWKKPKTNPTEGPNPQAHIRALKTLVNIKGGNFKNNHYSLGGVVVDVQAFRRENGGFGSDFVPDIFSEGHARPGIFLPSLLVLLIARAPFATSLATIDLFCPVLIDLLVCVRWTMKLKPTLRSRARLNRRSSNAPRSRPLWLSENRN